MRSDRKLHHDKHWKVSPAYCKEARALPEWDIYFTCLARLTSAVFSQIDLGLGKCCSFLIGATSYGLNLKVVLLWHHVVILLVHGSRLQYVFLTQVTGRRIIQRTRLLSGSDLHLLLHAKVGSPISLDDTFL